MQIKILNFNQRPAKTFSNFHSVKASEKSLSSFSDELQSQLYPFSIKITQRGLSAKPQSMPKSFKLCSVQKFELNIASPASPAKRRNTSQISHKISSKIRPYSASVKSQAKDQVFMSHFYRSSRGNENDIFLVSGRAVRSRFEPRKLENSERKTFLNYN